MFTVAAETKFEIVKANNNNCGFISWNYESFHFFPTGPDVTSVSQSAPEAAEGHGTTQVPARNAAHHGRRQTQEVPVLGHAASAKTW